MSGMHLTLGSRSGCCAHMNSFRLIFEVDLEMPGTHLIQDLRSGCCMHMNSLCVIFEVDHEMTARVQPMHAVILVWFWHQLHSGWLLKEAASGSREDTHGSNLELQVAMRGCCFIIGWLSRPGGGGGGQASSIWPFTKLVEMQVWAVWQWLQYGVSSHLSFKG